MPERDELADLARRRLLSQRLLEPSSGAPRLSRAADVVRWLGAVQSQDYLGAKWGVAQRTDGLDSAAIDREFDAGEVLRTHVLRPTWHFVAPDDIRWLLALTGPRVHAGSAGRHRQLELDATTLGRSDDLIAEAVTGGRSATRRELGSMLASAGIDPTGQRLPYLLMHAELHGLICSGPLRGRQHTYALLDERVPVAPVPSREEAVTELTRRYFTSHGPATEHDFAWWSGLTVADARRGIAVAGADLERMTIEDRAYWWGAGAVTNVASDGQDGSGGQARHRSAGRRPIHLLPNFDEAVVAYRDHTLAIHPAARSLLVGRADLVFGGHHVAVDGLVVGGWRRLIGAREVVVETRLAVTLSEGERLELAHAVDRFARFLGRPVRVVEAASRPAAGMKLDR